MKHGFVIVSLVVVACFCGTVVSEAVGMLPSGISIMFGLPLFVGWFVGAGIFTMACRDYARMPGCPALAKRKPTARSGIRAKPVEQPHAAWPHPTVST